MVQSRIENLIYVIRNQQVMLDSDLAMLYQVETKRLNEAVKRNIARFPEKFCFRLTEDEEKFLKSQIATSK
ncbi:MAG TPA: ORF6N domain-containing protein [Candidatus Dorea intestinavium]|nr:ORF6N domain-containing protein [Candidatus Dorea intestinavium]